MARIGHSSPRAALIYQHATAEREKRIADALDVEIAAASQATGLRLWFPRCSPEHHSPDIQTGRSGQDKTAGQDLGGPGRI